MTRSSIIAVAAALGFCLAASAAEAHFCDDWGCGTNGVSLNGTSYQGVRLDGIQAPQAGTRDLRQTAGTKRPTVEAVVLPSGETVDLR